MADNVDETGAPRHSAAHSTHNLDPSSAGYDPEHRTTSFRDLTPDVHPIPGAGEGEAAGHTAASERPATLQGQESSRPPTVGGERDPDALRGLAPGTFHNVTGTTHIPGEEDQDPELRNKTTYLPEKEPEQQHEEEKPFSRPQGDVEYPGRDYAHVVSHSTFGQYGAGGTEAREAAEQRAIDAEAAQEEHHAEEPKSARPLGYAGVGAIGGAAAASAAHPHDQLQPSRSYIAESRPSSAMPRPQEQPFAAQDYHQPQSLADNTNRVSRQPSYVGTQKTQQTATPHQPQMEQQAYHQEQPYHQPNGHQGHFIEGDTAAAPAVAVGTGYHEQHQPQQHYEAPAAASAPAQQPSVAPASVRQSVAGAAVPVAVAAAEQRHEDHQAAHAPQEAQQTHEPEQDVFQRADHQQLPPIQTGRPASKRLSIFSKRGDNRQSYISQNKRQSYINGNAGPTTDVQSAASPTREFSLSRRPISGGGLGAAVTTSGHELTSKDKKALKNEIKSEKKFEKTLQQEARLEAIEIEAAIKQAKSSVKKAEKSANYENAFRSTYEKAIAKEVKAKQRLLKFTNEYNKVAADLERATKEMEIRRNTHLANEQARDADNVRVDELRHRKGQNDMDREAKHGESMTKQSQAKRALSMSGKRRSMLI